MPIENKVIIQRLYDEVWNKRKVELLHLLLSPSHALHGPIFPGSSIGPEAYKQTLIVFTSGFPDLRFTVEEMVAEDEKVVCYWTISGTQQGEFMGVPATGKKVSVDGITIHHIANGKIMDTYVSPDMWGMMHQLGVVPALGEPQRAAAR